MPNVFVIRVVYSSCPDFLLFTIFIQQSQMTTIDGVRVIFVYVSLELQKKVIYFVSKYILFWAIWFIRHLNCILAKSDWKWPTTAAAWSESDKR